jgi:hypothetical protein
MTAPTPLGVRLIVVSLAISPLVQSWAVLGGRRFLVFGENSWGAWLTWAAIAPVLSYLLFRRDRRARFSSYIFLTALAWRGIRTGDAAQIGMAAVILLYFQLPSVRRVFPRINPAEVFSRARRPRP